MDFFILVGEKDKKRAIFSSSTQITTLEQENGLFWYGLQVTSQCQKPLEFIVGGLDNNMNDKKKRSWMEKTDGKNLFGGKLQEGGRWCVPKCFCGRQHSPHQGSLVPHFGCWLIFHRSGLRVDRLTTRARAPPSQQQPPPESQWLSGGKIIRS